MFTVSEAVFVPACVCVHRLSVSFSVFLCVHCLCLCLSLFVCSQPVCVCMCVYCLCLCPCLCLCVHCLCLCLGLSVCSLPVSLSQSVCVFTACVFVSVCVCTVCLSVLGLSVCSLSACVCVFTVCLCLCVHCLPVSLCTHWHEDTASYLNGRPTFSPLSLSLSLPPCARACVHSSIKNRYMTAAEHGRGISSDPGDVVTFGGLRNVSGQCHHPIPASCRPEVLVGQRIGGNGGSLSAVTPPLIVTVMSDTGPGTVRQCS